MTNDQKDNLFILVKSLTKSEKGNLPCMWEEWIQMKIQNFSIYFNFWIK